MTVGVSLATARVVVGLVVVEGRWAGRADLGHRADRPVDTAYVVVQLEGPAVRYLQEVARSGAVVRQGRRRRLAAVAADHAGERVRRVVGAEPAARCVLDPDAVDPATLQG